MTRSPWTLAVLAVAVALVATGVAGGATAGSGIATDRTGVGADVAVAVTAGADPELSLSIDSKPVEGGDQYGTATDPELDIEASVGENASADREITEVVVRVNGDFYRNYSTAARNVSKSVRLDLETGGNTVRVIATDDRDRGTSTTFTVLKDDRRPSVYLTAPYGTTPYVPIRDGTVNGSWQTFNGTVLDDSNVSEVTITRSWADENDANETVVPVRDVDETVSERLFLGRGENQIRITAEDELDNTKIYDFTVTVSDTAPPNVTLDPHPTRINQSELVLSGRVTDDVWVDRARIVVTGVDNDERIETKILRSADYHINHSRTNTAFEKSVSLLQPGTYRVNVTLEDVVNRTTSRTFRVERLPDDDRPVAPEIQVDRERTVVLDPETLFVDGLVFDGQTRRVVVETRDPATGRTVGYHRIFSGTNRRRVAFDRNVTIQADRTKVIVRAVDANGVEHARRFFVDGATLETFVGNGSASGDRSNASVTLTPLAGDVGMASAAVEVSGAEADTRVTVPPRGGADAVAETDNVTLSRVTVGLRADANFTLGVTTRDRASGGLIAPSDARPAATTTVQHSVSNDRVSDATFRYRVRRSYLAAHGFDPSNLTVYRRADGQWSTVETTVLGGNGTHVRYRADSPGLSVFTIASSSPAPAAADANASGSTDANGTSANATDGGSTNGTASPADDSGGADATDDPDEAQILVENVTLNATAVSPGEPVAVNATLVNDGDADGSSVAALRVLDPPNVTLVDRQRVTVPAGGARNTTLVHRFNGTGTYNVSVNGTRAGPVTVGGGGLLSFLSLIPVRLIGMGVGGLVGLGLVAVLVRFVLRRVGGGGEEAGG